ncbi:MAG: hypothetical protein AAFQ43_03430 [Bacteroidota bacterium]
MPDHLSDSHAADVLRRAALLQARSDHASGARLSLDDLKQAAEAAGIEPRYVEQAYFGAGDDLTPDPPFLGIETGIRRVRVVPGRISEAEWGRIVFAFRREIGDGGNTETIGEVREWSHGQTRIQLEPDGPNTRIVARSRWDGDAKVTSVGAILYGIVALVLAGFALAAQASWALVVLLGAMGLVHGAYAWGPLRARAPKRAAQLDRALDAAERLALTDENAVAQEAAARAEVRAPEASGDARRDSPRLDPALFDAPAPEAELHSDRGSARQRDRG